MKIVFIRNKYLKVIMALFIAVLSTTVFYLHITETETNGYRYVFATRNADESEKIEIFDIGKEKVVLSVPADKRMLDEAKSILDSITGIYVKANALPENGFIIKVAFRPELVIDKGWIVNYDINPVEKMFIIVPEGKTPYLLLLDNHERPYLFNFKRDIDKLLKYLEFQREADVQVPGSE